MQIDAKQPHRARQDVKIRLENPALSLDDAKDLAKQRARETGGDPMLLSWHSGKTGEFWPRYECGAGGAEPWVVFAEARGCNLSVDVNDGDYVFYFLLL